MIRDEVKKMKKKRMSNGIKFLLAVVGIYAIVALFDPALVEKAVIKTVEIFIQIIPILILVFAVIYIINRYLDPQKIQKHIGEKSGIKGWLYAVIAGVLIAGPPYVLYPVFGDLQKKGMKNSLIAVILYNRNVKIQFLPAMIYYFGLPFSVVMSIYMIIFSLLNGIVVEKLAGKNEGSRMSKNGSPNN
ncbi:MAG: permease [Patescibacteria group bacterium]